MDCETKLILYNFFLFHIIFISKQKEQRYRDSDFGPRFIRGGTM